MTAREYRQDDRTEGYCPQCGATLTAMTTDARGFCEVHGWQWADWAPRRGINYARWEWSPVLEHSDGLARPSDRDPGDETGPPNLTPGVMTGEENDRP